MANNLDTLRDELFKTLAALNDKGNPMDLERAKAVAAVGQVIVNSAKVEVDYVRATASSKGSDFLEMPDRKTADAPLPDGVSRSVHKIR